MIYAGACVMLGLGAQTAAVATVVGEVTNPLQNIWFCCKDIPGLSEDYAALSPYFTYTFVIVRCVVTPLWSVDVIWFCTFMPNRFGAWGPIFAILCVAVNIGGILWARGLWNGYAEFLKKQETKGD